LPIGLFAHSKAPPAQFHKGNNGYQNGDAITGTLVFTPPQADRVQAPISSGVVSKDSVTFSGQNRFQMASIEITFHGRVSDTTLSGTADMTSRSMILGPATETASLSLTKQ
jgi:hypothetical protein